MKINFFEKELVAVRQRFNQTFGNQIVCNLETRYRVILAVIHMGMLAKKICKTRDKSAVRDDIRTFIRIKKTLMTIFSDAEKIWHERRCYENSDRANRGSGQRGSVG